MPDVDHRRFEPDLSSNIEAWKALKWRERIEQLLDDPDKASTYTLTTLRGVLGDASFQLGALQTEAWLVYNLLEQTKGLAFEYAESGNIDVRKKAIEFGKDLGFETISKSASDGGPPNSPWSSLGNWLLSRLTAIGKAMHDLALGVISATLNEIYNRLKVEVALSIGLVLGFPPGVTFNFEPIKIKADMMEILRDMLERFYEGQGRERNMLRV
jgi:hypothetical protein